jgi:hypothetical protein
MRDAREQAPLFRFTEPPTTLAPVARQLQRPVLSPIFAANRFPCRSRTHQYGLVGIPAPPCAAPPGMAMAGIRSARPLPRRYRLKSRHGFPLISIEQNNLSRAPGYRVSLQLVDICRTIDFEDTLRREASKPVRWLPSVCQRFGAGECLGQHAPLSSEGHDR